MSELIRRHVLRYICPFCRRGHSSLAAGTAHLERCYRNPSARSCKTCMYYEPGEKGDGTPYGYPGCDEDCGKNIDISDGLKIGCAHWEGGD